MRAAAQNLRSENPWDARAAYIERVEIGWNGHTAIERWTPLVIWVGGGEKGFSGVVSVSFPQDSTQAARIVAPASGTPGRITPVELAVVLPRNLDEIEVKLLDQSGRMVDRVSAVTAFPTERQVQLDMFVPGNGGPVVVTGGASLLRAGLSNSKALFESGSAAGGARAAERATEKLTAEQAWFGIDVQGVDVWRLPRAEIAYEGVRALVIDVASLGKLEPRARESVQRWLVSGGRVVVVAALPGAEWRQVMPAGAEYDLVSLAEPAEMGMPAELGEKLKVGAPRMAHLLEGTAGEPATVEYVEPSGERVEAEVSGDEEVDGEGMEPESGGDSDADADSDADGGGGDEEKARESEASEPPVQEVVIPAAERVSGRLASLTPLGMRCGWSVRWVGEREGAGLLASGPVGFGRLTILGVDPERVAAIVSKAGTSAIWLEGMRDVAGKGAGASEGMDYWIGSGETTENVRAIRSGMDDLVGERSLGVGALFPLWLGLCLLAVLIGPVDAIVLKRLGARQRSWATALGWIGLISVGAGYAPTVLRAAPTTLDRVRVLDVRLAAEGNTAPLAFESGVTCLFGGRAAEVGFGGFAPGRWVRGVAASGEMSMDRRVLSPLETHQGITGSGDLARVSNLPSSVWLGQWTMRALADQGAVGSVIGGEVVRESAEAGGAAGGDIEVDVWGLPAGAMVKRASVLTGKIRRGVEVEEGGSAQQAVSEDGRWAMRFTSGMVLREMPAPPGINEYNPFAQLSVDVSQSPDALCGLPGADVRGPVMAELAASGSWALVMLVLEDDAGGVRITSEADGGRRWSLVRVLMPVSGAGVERAEGSAR
ncbi:MAG: hypothetical protein IT435_05275 [Phycisphaerales bacterium]|nr:hypothetical protein [Phycisphaerales bacterium]